MPQQTDPSRFERASFSDVVGTSQMRSRINLQPTDDFGDFLSRLWALYGPPDEVGYEGFTYIFRDKETNVIFTAYSAGSGPAYGGFGEDASKLDPILDLFEELLQNTKPADCEIEFETDFGIYRTGAKDGIPFGETIEIEDD
jgi:hypothetical protein